MAFKRFQLRKYLRQLADMEQEFHLWQLEFESQAYGHPDDPRRQRAELRGEVLESLRSQLHQMFHELEQLPRLS